MTEVQIIEDSTLVLVARLSGPSGTGNATGVAGEGYWWTQDDVSSIACGVYERTATGVVLTGSPEIATAGVLFDTPHTDWTAEATAYNFRCNLDPALLPSGGADYTVLFRFTLASGSVAHRTFHGRADEVLGS